MTSSPHLPKPGRLFPARYGRLATLLSLVVILLVAGYSLPTGYTAIRYFKATHQRLNREVAAHIARFSKPFVGMRVNQRATRQIFFNAMVTNPSAEVYLLDTTGRVLVYQAPPQKIKRHRVDLQPVRQFIQTRGLVFVQGDNPRQAQEQQIISAAPVVEQGRLQGYVYVVLLGESYVASLVQLLKSHALEWGLMTTLFMLLTAAAIGFLVFYLLTSDLTRLIGTVIRFRNGDLTARTHLKSTSELGPLASAFNDMADELAHRLDQLRESEQLRRDLVANVSHDLRSPMTSIRGYAETLDLETPLTPAQKRYVGAILQSTHQLTKRINELFELSKLEARERQPHMEPFLLGDLLTETVTNFHLIARQKDIALQCVNCEVPAVCYADVNMVEQVLQNLVENAIRYSPEHESVRIELTRDDGHVMVGVYNPLMALPPSTLEYLLPPNQAEGEDVVRRPPSMGLGLAIVRKILRLHASALQVSLPREGEIRFSFSLAVYPLPPRELPTG